MRQVFEGAVVRRVDEGLGLLCELPAEGGGALPLAPGYAHISNLADAKVEDLSQVGRITLLFGLGWLGLGCVSWCAAARPCARIQPWAAEALRRAARAPACGQSAALHLC